jgi:molybdopterin-guanine dinucleotide biosynthesis protein MobB
MRLYGVIGRKDAGKTHLMVRLVAHFAGLGLRVATVKHAHHDAEVDQPGRDSHRHRIAGAAQVMLASPAGWALMTPLRGAPEPGLDALLARLDPADLVLVEGFKAAPHPKVEVWRAALPAPPLAGTVPGVRALACDRAPPGLAVPVLALDDSGAIAAFIAREVGL